ncbi:MAG: hypothetical protein JSV44_01870 [Candidatus Zixiibacteriota bacterium]|nr:MAG: hypothetical protein JSV44_01870 [candidate division Zixibacteria bacterium]
MKYALLLPFIMLALLAAGCGGDDDSEPPPNGPVFPDPVYLTVNTSADAPDLNSIDPAWNNIDSVDIEVGGFPAIYGYDPQIGKKNVVVRGILKSGILYLFARWPDVDADVKGRYLFKNITGDFSVDISKGEDKFFVMFDAGDNGTEKANCATMCHDAAPRHKTTTGHADVWVWKASTTHPASLAEDTWWDTDGIETDYPSDFVKTPVYERNLTTPFESGWPKYQHVDGPDFSGPFLYYDDTVTFVPPGAGWEEGDSIPGYVIDSAYHDTAAVRNSRWDVDAYGEHAAGKWTVVFARAINTTESDDVDLTGVDTVQVSIGVNDNHPANSPYAHSCSLPFYIILGP